MEGSMQAGELRDLALSTRYVLLRAEAVEVPADGPADVNSTP